MTNSKFSNYNSKFIVIAYCLVIFLLLLYSYTQVDLGLTLTRAGIWQIVQRAFQYIGYFNRPLSTGLYLFLLAALYGFYGWFLALAQKKKLSRRTVWTLVIITTVVLTAAYNAFSYDLFNYIFDARIITHYHQSPYEHKALDYPGDRMLGFMHWTHRTYPYGPVWLGITVPLSFVGMQIFLITLALFKLMASASFIGTVYFIEKIVKKLFPEHTLVSIIFFALNPLVIIECLVSAHLDIVMLFFSIVSLYLLLEKRRVLSFVFMLLSIGVKFATALLVPVYGYLLIKGNKQILWERVVLALIAMMGIGVIAAALRTNYQPWYFLLVLPFAALLSHRYYIRIPVIVFSLFSLLQYVPFLYLGNWDPPVPTLLTSLTDAGIVVSVLLTLGWYVRLRGQH